MTLITFEGGECAGKGTQIKLLNDALIKQGFSVNSTHFEPGSTPKSELLRIIVKNKFDTNFKFPKNVIKNLDLNQHKSFFEQDKISAIAKNYLEDTLKNSKTPLKNDLIKFVLCNDLPENSELENLMKKLRKNIKNPAQDLFRYYFSKENLTPRMQENIFYAARNILFHNYIKKSLKEYDVTIIDRSLDSTAVYQGRVFNPERLQEIRQENLLATENITPDITFFIDIPIDEIQKRLTKKPRGEYNDFFDGQKKEFHEKVRQGYVDEMNYYKNLQNDNKQRERMKYINGKRQITEIHEEILSKTINYIEKTKI